MPVSCYLDSFPVQDIGVDKRRQDHQKNDFEEDPKAAEKTGEHDHQTADDPKPAGEAVGFVPVFFAVQRPGDLNTDGVILLAFGQVIADNGKHKSHKHRHDHFHPHIVTHGNDIGGGKDQVRQHRDDPKDQVQNLVGVIVFLRIGGGAKHTEPLKCQHQQWHTEYQKGLTGPAVDLTGSIPMGRELVRQLIPEDEASYDREQDHQGCNDQKLPILLNHVSSPFSVASHSITSSKTEVFSS